MHIDDHTITLIVRKLNGLASKEELHELQNWILADPAHQKEYDVYLNIWQETGSLSGAPAFDTVAAWAKMEQAISATPVNDERRHKRVVPMFFRKIAVAASVLALALVGWYVYEKMPAREIAITATANQRIELEDGTAIELRKGAHLTYPGRFTRNHREVRLSGEAYFRVHRNENAPFHILTNNAEVTVLGTSFFVRSVGTLDEVMVTSGTVKVAEKNHTEGALLITTGQQATLSNARLVKTLVSDSNFLAWKSGVMVFKNAPLTKVLADIANYYNLPLITPPSLSEQIKKIPVTVRFDNQPMSQVFDELSLITGLNIHTEGGKLTCTASQ